MTTNNALYNLVFFGADLQGVQRVEALNALAPLMGVPPEQVGSALNERHNVIMGEVSLEAGNEVLGRLLTIGIRCNLLPCTVAALGSTLGSLKLVPLERPTTVITCPACGQAHRVMQEAAAPTICDACGVVFAKFEQAMELKAERELVRQSLLTTEQRQRERA
ncbi:MAG TPA: hypothetical protein VES73_08265, partial [Lamprocystis sp. (in: g-proteobacteria)]|nr:hypothetical protein [Lamprocystis sp. (in: g-proteobacteria)]